jgi:predicted RNase H-like HicB family nuclease
LAPAASPRALNGLSTFGETKDEALANTGEAIRL